MQNIDPEKAVCTDRKKSITAERHLYARQVNNNKLRRFQMIKRGSSTFHMDFSMEPAGLAIM